ncbi:MAG: hypothetical protein Q8K63_15955, partial [Acidimicrobiales bacterium]|nr:hypothetical protein [Acidimicrobiales bacterium]
MGAIGPGTSGFPGVVGPVAGTVVAVVVVVLIGGVGADVDVDVDAGGLTVELVELVEPAGDVVELVDPVGAVVELVVRRGFDLVEFGSSSSDFGEDLVGGFVPHERFGIAVAVLGPLL